MRRYVTTTLFISFGLVASLGLVACDSQQSGDSADQESDQSVVDSGTYTGTITEVNAEEDEIYVETDDGQELELYFIEKTKLTQGGETTEFSTLEKGQTVEVEVEKVGKRLDPLSVDIKE